MKKLQLNVLALFSLFAVSGYAQVTDTGGNVGIGTTNPAVKLDVVGDIQTSNAGYFITKNSDNKPTRVHGINASNVEYIGAVDQNVSGTIIGTTTDKLYLRTNSLNAMYISNNQNIGIGTTNPTGKLEVLKNANLSSSITIPNSGLVIRSDNNGNDATLRFGVDNTNLKAVIQAQQTTTGTKFDLLFNPFGGNIGIGTTSPSEKLTVNGKILCEEVEVVINVNAPDYVFEKYYNGHSNLKADYVMPTLEEVEAYTKANNHLENVPSAKTLKEEGLQLKDMSIILLQKIEELTLYTIEQEKRIKALEGQLVKK